MPRHLLLVLVLAVLCLGSTGRAAEFPENLSVLVLTFDLAEPTGASLVKALQTIVREDLSASAPPSLGDFLLSRGAKWTFLETASTLQLGMFLPMAPEEAEEIASVFLKHLAVRLAAARLPPASPGPLDELRRFSHHLIARPNGRARVSLWLQGGFRKSAPKLEEIAATIALPSPAPSPGPPSADLVIPNEMPRAVHLAIWDRPSGNAIVSAKFLGERFIRLPTANQAFSYDIWTFPEGVVLTLVATAPLDRLWEKDGVIADFLQHHQEIASSPQWAAFAAQSSRLHEAERKDLEKGAFLEAWGEHLGLPEPGRSLFAFQHPDRLERVVCLPHPFLHRISTKLDSNPRYSAISASDLGDTVHLVVALQGSPELLSRLGSRINLAGIPELTGSTWETTIDGLLLWSWSVPRTSVSYSLSTARSALESAMKAEGQPATPLDPFPGLRIAVVGVGSPKSFILFGLLQLGWPGLPGTTPACRPLDLDGLRTVLDLPAAPASALKGRWTIKTAMSSGMAHLVSRLLLMNILPESLEKVEGLF